MKSESVASSVWAGVVLLAYVVLFAVVPLLVTQLIFQYSPWAAKVIVFFVAMTGIGYGIVESRLHLTIYRLIKNKFGVKIY